ncbi:MAG: hypothetical protein U0R23_09145 [Candidatus Nanopelagicales bacterium]
MSPKSRGRKQKPGAGRRRSTGRPPAAGPPNLARPVAQALEPTLFEGVPFPAEALMSHLLGTVWAGVEYDRAGGVEDFSAQLVADSVKGAGGRATMELLSRIAPPRAADKAAEVASMATGPVPQWAPLLDRVELVDATATRDIFGDQTNYAMLFGYHDRGRVVGRHILVAMVDHNLRLLKDAFLVEDMSLEQFADFYRTEPDLYVDPEPDLAWMAGDIIRAMDITDMTLDVVDMLGEATADTWYLLRSRIRRCLPPPAPDREDYPTADRQKDLRAFMRAKITTDFLATAVDGSLPDRETVAYLAQLFIDYACDRGRGAPTEWSPTAVELFLVDFAPRKVVWEAEDIPWVVPTLKVFVEWAQKRRQIVVRGRRETQAAIDRFGGDFVYGALGGAEPSFARGLVEGMIAAGVDLNDEAAIGAYVEEYNRRIDEGQ